MKICLVNPLHRWGPWTVPEYGVGSLPMALGADLFPFDAPDLAPLEAYDALILHVGMGFYDTMVTILDRFPNKTIILNLTCDAMYIDPHGFFPGWRIPLKALLDRAQLALCEADEVGFFQAMTATPVAHLALPVPLVEIRAVRGARSATPLVYLGSGFRPKKNGIATAMAFRRLRALAPVPVQGVIFAEEPEAEREACRLWGVEGVDVRPCCDQMPLWQQLATFTLALHLDYRRTVGRFSGECAALGLPCISTGNVTMQRILFPDLIVGPWDVDGAATLALRLLADPSFRDRVVAQAARAIEPYALAPMAARFHEILRRVLPRLATD